MTFIHAVNSVYSAFGLMPVRQLISHYLVPTRGMMEICEGVQFVYTLYVSSSFSVNFSSGFKVSKVSFYETDIIWKQSKRTNELIENSGGSVCK